MQLFSFTFVACVKCVIYKIPNKKNINFLKMTAGSYLLFDLLSDPISNTDELVIIRQLILLTTLDLTLFIYDSNFKVKAMCVASFFPFSTWHKLGSFQKTESQLNTCFITLTYREVCGTFLWLLMWTVPPLGRWSWAQWKIRLNKPGSKSVKSTPLWPLLLFLPPGSCPPWVPTLTILSDGVWPESYKLKQILSLPSCF